MREILEDILQAIGDGRQAACCRLVETRGSTPQKAGAAMLVYAGGSQRGTLGGGCVEAEVKRHALASLHAGEPSIARYQLDSDYGWDDGLICGGRMTVLIEPLSAANRDYFASYRQLAADGRSAVEAIVIDADAAHLPATATILCRVDGEPIAHQRLAQPCDAQSVSASVSSQTWRRPMVQGGVAYLPWAPRSRLVIVGGGHVGQAVARLAAELEFDVWIVDDREDFVSQERFPHAQRRIVGNIGEVLPTVPVDARTLCLIVTRGHNHDEEALYHLAERGAMFIGMIGSKRKIKLIFDDLLAAGISAGALARVHAPVGLAIGSQTVAEIAVSIAAQLVAVRSAHHGARPARASELLSADVP